MRPRDPVTNALMPPAHKRLNMAPFQEAALFRMAEDGRACALPVVRKLAMIDKAVDHVIDGDKPPKWIWETTEMRPKDKLLSDLWQVAVRECKRVAAHV
jgi:hypothetical protein